MADYIVLMIIASCAAIVIYTLARPWLHTDKGKAIALMGYFLSLALYIWIGDPFNVVSMTTQQQEIAQLRAQEKHYRDEMAKLAIEEISYKQWAELGVVQMQLSHYDAATKSLKQAVLDSDGKPELILLYGKALMMQADGNITQDAKAAFSMAAKLLPSNPEPKLYLAMERMQAGDIEEGRKQMKSLKASLPEDSPLRNMLENMPAAK